MAMLVLVCRCVESGDLRTIAKFKREIRTSSPPSVAKQVCELVDHFACLTRRYGADATIAEMSELIAKRFAQDEPG